MTDWTRLVLKRIGVFTLFQFFGLGKSRSKFGKFIDKRGITQIEIEKASGLSRGTVSRICNDDDYVPKYSTIAKIQKALKKLGENVPDDYFNM